MECEKDYEQTGRVPKRSADEDDDTEEIPNYFSKKSKSNYVIDLKNAVLKPMKPFVCDNIIMGVGTSHLVTYNVETGVFYLHEWDQRGIGKGLVLKDWPFIEDGALPIIEIHDDYVFRVDLDAFVYVSDTTEANLQFRVRCARPREDGNLDVFTVSSATITNSAIVMVSCPSPDKSIVIVCPDWMYGNSRCVFIESSIPNITSVVAESLTNFVFTSSIGLCHLAVGVAQPEAWILLPMSSINQALTEQPYDKDYKDREQLYIQQYNNAVVNNDPIDLHNVSVLSTKEFPLLPKDQIPMHCCVKGDEYTVVSSKYFYHIDQKSSAILSEPKEAYVEDTTMLACSNLGNYYIAITDDAELIVLGKTGRTCMHILAYYSTHYQEDHELLTHSLCPPNAVFTLCGSILAVSLFQRSLFLFEISDE